MGVDAQRERAHDRLRRAGDRRRHAPHTRRERGDERPARVDLVEHATAPPHTGRARVVHLDGAVEEGSVEQGGEDGGEVAPIGRRGDDDDRVAG